MTIAFHFARCSLLVILLSFRVSTEASTPDLEYVAFIGQIVGIEELPEKCTARIKDSSSDPESICVMFDAHFEATYEVIDVLTGNIESTSLTFNIADHYGFPDFAEYQHALLFVSLDPDGNWLEKYQGYPIHRTENGSWAYCGNPYGDRAGDPGMRLQSIEFAGSLGIIGEFSKYGIEMRFFDNEGYLTISDGHIKCQKGVYATDLYEFIRSGVMTARGISLPELVTVENDL